MDRKKIHDLLQIAHNMVEEGKLSEVLKYLQSLEPLDNYTTREKVIFYTLQSRVYVYLDNVPKAHETAEMGVELAHKIEKGAEVVDIFIVMAAILSKMKKPEDSMTLLDESAEILENISPISEKEHQQRLGLIKYYKTINFVDIGKEVNTIELLKEAIDLLEKGGTHGASQVVLAGAYAICGNVLFFKGEYNEALLSYSQSQKICENKESPQYNIPKLQNILGRGTVFGLKGDLQLALDYLKKGLSLARKVNKLFFICWGLNNLAGIYRDFGEYDQALIYLKEALPIAEKIGKRINTLDNFFHVYIAKGDIPAAQHIFHQIEELRDKEKKKDNKLTNLIYRIEKAILLKTSTRTRDLGAAQELFSSIANEEVYHIEGTQAAILNLCEMLLNEFNNTKDVEALEEFSVLMKRLQGAAEKQHAYKILAETYVLDAKLSLLKFDPKKARYSLTQAQQIAERYGLNQLAIKISGEHDKLLQNLEMWDQMKNSNVPMSDRLEKIDLNDQLLTMLKKKPAEISEPLAESPILLLIMADSGIPLYTKIFSEEWKVSEDLFSSFLSAFNSFSDEVFSEGLDRASFGKFTILMTGMSPFMICYVFTGQSFLAQQKFSQFSEHLQKSEPIRKNLTEADRIGRVIQDNASEGLGQLVETVF